MHVPRLIVPLSLERAFMDIHERFWDSHRIKSMGSSQYTCSPQSCHGFKDKIWTLCLARYSLWAFARMLEVFCSPAAYSMPHFDSYENDTFQQPGGCTRS